MKDLTDYFMDEGKEIKADEVQRGPICKGDVQYEQR